MHEIQTSVQYGRLLSKHGNIGAFDAHLEANFNK